MKDNSLALACTLRASRPSGLAGTRALPALSPAQDQDAPSLSQSGPPLPGAGVLPNRLVRTQLHLRQPRGWRADGCPCTRSYRGSAPAPASPRDPGVLPPALTLWPPPRATPHAHSSPTPTHARTHADNSPDPRSQPQSADQRRLVTSRTPGPWPCARSARPPVRQPLDGGPLLRPVGWPCPTKLPGMRARGEGAGRAPGR